MAPVGQTLCFACCCSIKPQCISLAEVEEDKAREILQDKGCEHVH